MQLRSRGWDRNHGWREIVRQPLRRAREVGPEWRLGGDEAIIEPPTISADQRGGGIVNVYFRAEVQRPALNGNYMMNIRMSKWDAARLFLMSMRGAPADYMIEVLGQVQSQVEGEE